MRAVPAVLLVAGTLLSAHCSAPAPAARAKAGVLDLRDFPFQSKAAQLDGEWAFHWHKFILPSEIPETETFQDLPGIWQRSPGIPGTGYATYRLRVLLPHGLSSLALRVKHTETAYRVFANGVEIGNAGIPGDSADKSHPSWQIRTFPLHPASEIDLLLHVSNYHHARGGPGYSLELGTQPEIEQVRNGLLARDALLFGSLIIMCIYHLVIYMLRRGDDSPLYFALVCAVISCRVISTGDTLLEVFYGHLPYNVHARLVYLSFYLAVPAFAAYLRSVFPQLFPLRLLQAIAVLALAQSAVVAAAPPLIFTRYIDIYYVFTGLVSIPLLTTLARALLRRENGSRSMALGFVVLVAVYINDVLHNKSVINTGLYSPYAFIFFIATQAYLLARRFSNAFRLSETLSQNLEVSNRGLLSLRDSLEQRVQERTADLETARAAAEKSALAKSEFLALMSHEIRTPMNGIVGMLDLLRESKLDQDQERAVSIISTSVNNLRTILNDILDFSKIESGKLELVSAPFSPRQCLENALAVVSADAVSHGLSVRHHAGQNVPSFILGDELRLQQVLLNLLSNAVKFTEQGIIEASVQQVTADGEHALLRFEVRDTGIGIAPERAAALFQAFTQLNSPQSARKGGTGLGLAISKRLVALMGGEIGLDSKPGQGSTFWFTIRARISEHGPAPVERQQAAALDLPAMRILVVEDNVFNQEVIVRILARFGIKPEMANNGLEAVQRIENGEQFDAILMDLEMPVMDGHLATAKIRSLSIAQPYIAALTAHALSGTRENLLAAGFDDHITKPVSKAEIGEALARIAAAVRQQAHADGISP